MSKFTQPDRIFQIGQKIFPVDFSMFHKPEDEIEGYSSLRSWEVDELKKKLENGIPLIVKSIPYKLASMGGFRNEYYIEVSFKDSPEVLYCTGNSKSCVFNNAYQYLEFLRDCEACAMCGY